uniref:Uncharacterized protein n=1 Tax=Rhizophora mucronata TaxID=61149 RepID=A0A2P2R3W9_RHIMU
MVKRHGLESQPQSAGPLQKAGTRFSVFPQMDLWLLLFPSPHYVD